MYLSWWCALVVVWRATPVAAVVGGAPAVAPEPDAAVVFIQRHGRSARLEGIKDDKLGYYSFFGIRYAEPAVGPRRFQRPVRRLLAGDTSATKHCLPCPQPDPRGTGKVVGHEDCLCLNVFAPKMPGDEQGSPVVFFIHGGNYRSGSTSYYGGQHLAQKDTILVTAQYRLGSLGYLSTGQKDASGNAGLFDLRAAMAWINDYIEFFGGDPTRIVVMGQGSGGSAASLLAMSAESRAATGVATLSGTPLSPGAVRPDPGKHAKELANATGCPSAPSERLLMCLRKLSVEKIIRADMSLSGGMMDLDKFLEEISGRSGSGARVEGGDDLRALPPLVAEDPADALEKKEKRCPLLTGVTSAETSRAIYGKYSKFLVNQLAAVRDFIKNQVVDGLRAAVTGVHGLVPKTDVESVIPVADFYQAVFDNTLEVADGLGQIAEATGDALFNFPAYQSVRAWSKSGSAYLYSFEYVGNMTKGSYFLPGVPLAENSANSNEQTSKGPSHGDELAYIFEPLNEEGQSVSSDVSSSDAQVRDSFVSLVAKFAHDLTPLEKKNDSLLGFLPFSKDNDQYIKIKNTITLEKDFRFCQMALWGNMVERITGVVCKNIIGNILRLPKLPIKPLVPLPVTNLPILPNVLGSQSQTTKPKLLPDRFPFRL